MVESLGLLGLFFSAFLSATLLPGNSELALILYLRKLPTLWIIPVMVATVGNTLGGMVTFYMARLLPKPGESRALRYIERFGMPLLFFSWLPVLGDAFCAAAGWLRMRKWQVLMWIFIGKLTRYLGVLFLNQLW